MFFDKKGVGPVVIITIFLMLVVIFVVFFQNWYQNYNSVLTAEIDENSYGSLQETGIETMVEGNLHIVNNKNYEVPIIRIVIFEQDCDDLGVIFGNLTPGFNVVNVSNCVLNLDGLPTEVKVYTTEDLYTKNLIIDEN